MKRAIIFSLFSVCIFYNFLQAQCLNTSSITPGNSISICVGSSLCIPAQAGSNYQWMQNPNWNDLGNPLFSVGQAAGNVIALDPSDVPYVAYRDFANGVKCTVMKLSGSTWTNVGLAAFTPSSVNHLSMAIDNSGTPYVAFMDGSVSGKLSVMKFNGTSWVFVGPQGFNPGTGGVWYNGIAFDATGVPYVAYRDFSISSSGISVMKFNGSAWVLVGPQGFSAGQADYTWIKFDPAGTTPYVVYTDAANSYKLTAMKFNGSSWIGVGPPGFTPAGSNDHGIAFDKTGTLHVCFQDQNSGNQASVMKFNGSSWVNVGLPGFSGCCTGTFEHGIVFDAANIPYVAFLVGNGVESWRYNGTTWSKLGATILNPGSEAGIVVNNQGIPYVSYTDNLTSAKARVKKFDGTNVGANSTCYSPTVAGTYIVDVTQGCGGSLALNIVTVTAINPLPTITVNSGTICSGKTFTMFPSGASSYTFSSGSATVSPGTTTSYSVTGTSSLGCVSSNTAISVVNVNPSPTVSITGSLSICNGNATLLFANGASTYSWNTSATTSSISVNPTVTSVYSVTGTGTNACTSTSSNTVIVNPLPVVSVNNGTICNGQSFTMTPSGASTYTFSSGSAVVSPTSTSSFSVAGTSSAGCVSSNTAVSVITVDPLPIISISGTTLTCSGDLIILTASGASTYTWNTSASTLTISVSPTVSTTFSVTGTGTNTCANSQSISITVNNLPVVTAVSNSSLICTGQNATLTTNGANTYTWNTSATGTLIVVSPTINTTYTVTGTDSNGCSNTSVITQSVSACTGIITNGNDANSELIIFPNPSEGKFTIKGHASEILNVSNELGQILETIELNEKNDHSHSFNNFPKGIYFINGKTLNYKIIILD